MFSQTRTRSPARLISLWKTIEVALDEKIRTVPVGNVLVGDTGGNVEHDDTGLAVDVVTITETTELLLTGGVPDIELNGSQVLSLSS